MLEIHSSVFKELKNILYYSQWEPFTKSVTEYSS